MKKIRSSTKGPGRRRRLFRLWEKNRCCHWCKRETLLIFRPASIQHNKFRVLDNEATIDHLRDRYEGRLQVVHEEQTVLACWKCNNDRSREATSNVPKEELHKRAKNGHGNIVNHETGSFVLMSDGTIIRDAEGEIYWARGPLHYHHDKGYKLVVEVDRGLSDYYRSLIPKWNEVAPQMYPPHISVVRKETPKNLDVWGKYEGKIVEFAYTNHVYEGTVYWWLNAFSKELEDIRIELGLPVSTRYTRPPSDKWIRCFHLTLGNKKRGS